MAILKIICPHCNFNYVLPEDKVPVGDLTLSCPSCHQSFPFNKAHPNRPPGKAKPEPEVSKPAQATMEPIILRNEDEHGIITTAIDTPPPDTVTETKRSSGWEPIIPKELESYAGTTPTPVKPEAQPTETKRSTGWEPVIPKELESSPITAPATPEARPTEGKRSSGWEPVIPKELESYAGTTSTSPQIDEKPATAAGWQPVPKTEPHPVQTATEAAPTTQTYESSPAASTDAAKSGGPVAIQPPAPTVETTKKITKKSSTPSKQFAWKKWIILFLLVCITAGVAFFVATRPDDVARLKAMVFNVSGEIKQEVSTLVEENLAPKKPEINIPILSEPSKSISPEDAILRPAHYDEIIGTWSGRLSGDKKGVIWTFTFSPGNYDVLIKNNSGFWTKGKAVYLWDKGSQSTESLRSKPGWFSIDIKVINSSENKDAEQDSLGAFSRNKDELKLCLSRPGKMTDPIEKDTTGDIQCFELKKKE